MPMMAVVFPIVPGKTSDWRAFTDALNGSRRDEFEASRREAGVRERTYLQSTPMGDLVIVTMEGDDPVASFGTLLHNDDDFTRWFIGQATELHGLDPSQLPAGSPSELVVDSQPTAVAAG
jgi:hypothetical protein